MTHRNRRFKHPWGVVSFLFVCAFSWSACESEGSRNMFRDLETTANAMGAPHGPRFLRHAADAPQLQVTEVTFVAVQGRSHGAEIRYAPAPGNRDDDIFLRLELGAASLLRHPGGAPFEEGEQVTISIFVEMDPSPGSPGCLSAKLSPSGLEFNPRDPAKLMLSFVHADPDVDGDGQADLMSGSNQVAMWRQATPGASWEPVVGVVRVAERQVEAELRSFSRYALAF